MADEPKITKRKVSDYTPDQSNANKGTERGQYLIDTSVESVGLARSIVAASDDTIPAGNKTLQAALDAGIEDVIEVETDGNALVVVKRTDWDTVDSTQARQYAYLDNRASEVGLAWDAEQVLRDLDAGVDLSGMFRDDELAVILGDMPNADEWADGFGGVPDGDKSPFQQMTFTLHDTQADLIAQVLAQAKRDCDFDGQPNENSNGNALFMICKAYANVS
jgi:hypothetical protein